MQTFLPYKSFEQSAQVLDWRRLGKQRVEGMQIINAITGKTRKDGKPINYNLRFHLYPGLTAVKTMSGNGVLIQISKNKSLLFTIKDESIILEKSIFLGGNKILDNTCITISGNLVNKDKIFRWEIKKNI